MVNLKDTNISYIISSDINSSLSSYLYSRDYYIFDIKEYFQGLFSNSIIALTGLSNDDLRRDAIHILDHFNQDSLILKYKEESTAKKIFSDGQEKPMGIVLYNTDSNYKSYIYEGVSFSFVDEQIYYFPSKKEDFKSGMIVEYFSNNKWNQKVVKNPESEYKDIYELMIRYKKVRIPR